MGKKSKKKKRQKPKGRKRQTIELLVGLLNRSLSEREEVALMAIRQEYEAIHRELRADGGYDLPRLRQGFAAEAQLDRVSGKDVKDLPVHRAYG